MSIDFGYSCYYCGCTETPKKHQAKEMMFGTGESFELDACTSCGSLQLTNPPADLSVYYPPSYYSLQELVVSGPLKQFLKRLRYRLFVAGIRFLKPVYGDWMRYSGAGLNSRIADIGCGNGQLLYEMYAAGFKELEGFDPFMEKDSKLADGFHLFKKSIFEMTGKYDLLMMHHALEHMPQPEEVLKKCYQLLKKGGCLLIRIPVADAQVWKEEGVNWVQLDVPRHLHIPSTLGLKTLSEKIGFSVKKITFDSTDFQFWGTELYKKGIPLKDASSFPFPEELEKAFKNKALLYNQKGIGDQACFYLERNN
ncbi:class I SAM-dependent methyltransferase [Cecembia calidifontis]|uniref:Methyltransferase family protein n=1 Tax=Cecembia calidifontis TaxID=1187080 RepID=A0A4Q7P596_9BACT|nr:class I SAM-dependent methyltransferase [Cecembia calidifontis]RZS95203.1 methyltransferase family protein [Cecembia calidifontis]